MVFRNLLDVRAGENVERTSGWNDAKIALKLLLGWMSSSFLLSRSTTLGMCIFFPDFDSTDFNTDNFFVCLCLLGRVVWFLIIWIAIETDLGKIVSYVIRIWLKNISLKISLDYGWNSSTAINFIDIFVGCCHIRLNYSFVRRFVDVTLHWGHVWNCVHPWPGDEWFWLGG